MTDITSHSGVRPTADTQLGANGSSLSPTSKSSADGPKLYISNPWLAFQDMTQQEFDESILCEVSDLSIHPENFLAAEPDSGNKEIK